jgi:threonylcarbamoyladenosine tRNA methylthiotransferase MtaB
MRVFWKTYGCRVNQYETQALRERAGAQDATGLDDADVCVLNTCTVTGRADSEALALLRRITRRNPAARVIVTGCLATRAPRLVRAAAPHAEIVGNGEKEGLPALLGCSSTPAGGVAGLHGRARAFVKVQDGCNMNCAFCVIPAIRPKLDSKPWPALRAEVEGLVAAGRCEIVLCGIRLGRYLSRDGNGSRVDLCGAIERLLELPGAFRLRLSSLEITDASDRLFGLMARSDGKLCPSLHAPLQSGSTTVLRRMNRWYSADFYRRRAEAFHANVPKAALFADVMTGFPGETDGEHAESLAFAESVGFSGLHVFRYSRRPGTAAALLKAVPERTIARRAEQWRELDGRLRASFAARVVAQRRVVAPELDGREGLTEDFMRVSLEGRAPGGLAPAIMLESGRARLTGRPSRRLGPWAQ